VTKKLSQKSSKDRISVSKPARQETSFLHFFGFISYEDVFGDKQRTTFRYIWIPAQYLDVPEAEPSSVLIDEAGWEKNGGESENYAG
jgi:hypothetical protein